MSEECRDCGYELTHDGRAFRDNSGGRTCVTGDDHSPAYRDRALSEIFSNSVPGNFWGAER